MTNKDKEEAIYIFSLLEDDNYAYERPCGMLTKDLFLIAQYLSEKIKELEKKNDH
jgi:hypothetical protein